MYGVIGNNCYLCIFRNWKILATPGRKMMHSGRLIMWINVVQNEISDNFYPDHKAVKLNLTKLFFLNLMNKLKIRIFNFMAIRKKNQVLFHQHYTIMDTMQKKSNQKNLRWKFARCIPLSLNYIFCSFLTTSRLISFATLFAYVAKVYEVGD